MHEHQPASQNVSNALQRPISGSNSCLRWQHRIFSLEYNLQRNNGNVQTRSIDVHKDLHHAAPGHPGWLEEGPL